MAARAAAVQAVRREGAGGGHDGAGGRCVVWVRVRDGGGEEGRWTVCVCVWGEGPCDDHCWDRGWEWRRRGAEEHRTKELGECWAGRGRDAGAGYPHVRAAGDGRVQGYFR